MRTFCPRTVKTALEKLSPKRKVMTDLRVNPTNESPWNKRMTEIKDKLKH